MITPPRARVGLVVAVVAVLAVAVLVIVSRSGTATSDRAAPPSAGSGLPPNPGPAVTGTTVFVFPSSPPGELRQFGQPIAVGNWEVPAGVVYSTVAAWLYNEGTEPLRIIDWAPIGAQGVTITDVGIIPDLGGFSGYSGAVGFPPPGKPLGAGLHPLPFELHAVGPLDHSGDSGLGTRYWLLLGYRREASSPVGTVEGITLTYTVGDDTKQFHLSIRLTLCQTTCPS